MSAWTGIDRSTSRLMRSLPSAALRSARRDAEGRRRPAPARAREHRLARRAHGVDLDQPPLGDPANAGPPEGLGLDEAEELQVPERLTHGRLARAQLLRDARLDEPLARPVLAAQDPFEEQLLH